MKRRTALVVLASLVALAGTAVADETTFCNFFITTLPYTAAVQGHYCFNKNLSTAITSGNAITINADFVVIDLNNFKLGGGAAGVDTQTNGIYSNNHRNITIRNGNIRGFKYGVLLEGGGGGHLIENNVLDGNTYTGADVGGDLVVIRNNLISNTGGPTTTYWSYGIHMYSAGGSGALSVARDNVISNVFSTAPSGGGISYGITGGGDVADHNIIRMGDVASGSKTGIWAGLCRDNVSLNNDSGAAFYCALAGDNYTDSP